MFKNIFQGKSPEKLLIAEYKKHRNESKELGEVILKKYTDDQSLETTTRIMGIKHGKSIIIESEEEMNFVMDFSLFEYRVDGKNFIERYQASNPELSKNETKIIEAKLLAYSIFQLYGVRRYLLNTDSVIIRCISRRRKVLYTSLFKVVDTNPTSATLLLSDLLNNGQEVALMDINLSLTAELGHSIFMRLVPFEGINMSSGMFCAFPQSYERALLKEYKTKMKKVKSNIESQQKFIAFYKLGRTKGIATMTNSF